MKSEKKERKRKKIELRKWDRKGKIRNREKEKRKETDSKKREIDRKKRKEKRETTEISSQINQIRNCNQGTQKTMEWVMREKTNQKEMWWKRDRKGERDGKKKLERLKNREKNGKNQIRVSIITETMGYTFILIHSKRKEKVDGEGDKAKL